MSKDFNIREFEPRDPNAVTVSKWKLADQAIRDHPVLLERHGYFINKASSPGKHRIFTTFDLRCDYLVRNMKNWPKPSSYNFQWPIFVFGLASALYGGLHATAWNAFFPSAVEKMLWRISASSIAGLGFLWGILIALEQSYGLMPDEGFSFLWF